MSLMCHAEYLRDPEFIGDTKVDLTEVLTKGETDGSFASALTRFACVLTRIQSGLFSITRASMPGRCILS